ncbi:D-erythronate dehydrogenase-like [Pieris brassicae]|uniref:NAD-dependent epimerase/dehydratase domain-containing protein n=1 Tax=Pieris brassicae TaxID=7116 RepID=A0A9P0XF95_PIEBR|nr:D-erythronate dehydrogenase-like [Pieris brassicae]CAH4036413.1 unnamed protein product [Pieris brassicae]
MNVVVTGAAGFLGSRIADVLLSKDSPILIAKLLLADGVQPRIREDTRVSNIVIDLTSSDAPEKVIPVGTNIVFHLAAVVSGHAEADFDYGLQVNFDATRALLERARRLTSLCFVFTSTCGVFGGELPAVVEDGTATQPQNTYGTAKAMCELLLNDYGRKGFADTRIVRLPTVSVRSGTANRAVTSFASGIIREPLNGEEAICPVSEDLELWLSSPSTVVQNIIHAATVPAYVLGPWRVINLPGICVSVRTMIQSLREVAGEEIAALVRFERDDFVSSIVGSLPFNFNNSRSLKLGFMVDKSFHDIIRLYIQEDLKRKL